ncbi:MAG TPA: hypothetical protein VG474_14100 [Solirubrobacteraceae bacterium]|nr:hypothetical protein [Solirubrobacteraceae bacterium]
MIGRLHLQRFQEAQLAARMVRLDGAGHLGAGVRRTLSRRPCRGDRSDLFARGMERFSG